jgi:hypothetical protein
VRPETSENRLLALHARIEVFFVVFEEANIEHDVGANVGFRMIQQLRFDRHAQREVGGIIWNIGDENSTKLFTKK